MNRIGSALGWSVIGLIVGAIIGAVAGFAMGVIRIENVLHAALAGALPVGLLGALGAFAGRLLQKPPAGSDSLTVVTTFIGALLGALVGEIIGVALGADIWLLESIARIESEAISTFSLYHIDLVGGPHVVVGAFLGILIVGVADTFLGDNSTLNLLIVAALLTPFVAIIAALGGQIDWGTALVIVIAPVAIFYLMAKSGDGESTSTGGDGGSLGGSGKSKGKGKPKA